MASRVLFHSLFPLWLFILARFLRMYLPGWICFKRWTEWQHVTKASINKTRGLSWIGCLKLLDEQRVPWKCILTYLVLILFNVHVQGSRFSSFTRYLLLQQAQMPPPVHMGGPLFGLVREHHFATPPFATTPLTSHTPSHVYTYLLKQI